MCGELAAPALYLFPFGFCYLPSPWQDCALEPFPIEFSPRILDGGHCFVGEEPPYDVHFGSLGEGIALAITAILLRHYYEGHAAPGSTLAIGVGNALADNGGSNRLADRPGQDSGAFVGPVHVVVINSF